MPASRVKKGSGGGLASKLFNKFDSDRKYDPFLDDDPIIQDSKEGMVGALEMTSLWLHTVDFPLLPPSEHPECTSSRRAKRLVSTWSYGNIKSTTSRKDDVVHSTNTDQHLTQEALLSMCNAVEINSLFGALGFVVPCPRSAKEQQVCYLPCEVLLCTKVQ